MGSHGNGGRAGYCGGGTRTRSYGDRGGGRSNSSDGREMNGYSDSGGDSGVRMRSQCKGGRGSSSVGMRSYGNSGGSTCCCSGTGIRSHFDGRSGGCSYCSNSMGMNSYGDSARKSCCNDGMGIRSHCRVGWTSYSRADRRWTAGMRYEDTG